MLLLLLLILLVVVVVMLLLLMLPLLQKRRQRRQFLIRRSLSQYILSKICFILLKANGNNAAPAHPRPRPVVFLQHGLKGCSADWTIGGLAYALADLGYDVWMGNFRGNYFSDRHKSFAFNDPKFWDFSFEDHGHAGENFDSFVV